MSVHHDCDVLIVGSGAGGATTAAILAEAGHEVLIVEEGPWVEQGSVVPFSLEQMDQQYRSGGVTVALGLPSIAYTEGRCAGGGTEVNSGLYWRPPEATLDSWRTKYRITDFATDDLFSICEEVEDALSVQKVPGEHTPASNILRRGADRLGWRNDEIPRWMTYPDGAGATEGKRQSMTRTYLPRALAAGARMLCEHRLDKIVRTGRRATSAELTDLASSDTGRRRRLGHDLLPRRHRVRRCDPDPGDPAAGRAPPPGRSHARRPPDRQACCPLRRRGQHTRRCLGVSGQAVRPEHLVRRFGQPSRTRRARAHRQLARLRLGGHLVAGAGDLLRSDHERGAWPRPGHSGRARPARHLPAHEARSRSARAGTRSAGNGHARGRRRGGLSVVQGCARSCAIVPIWPR